MPWSYAVPAAGLCARAPRPQPLWQRQRPCCVSSISLGKVAQGRGVSCPRPLLARARRASSSRRPLPGQANANRVRRAMRRLQVLPLMVTRPSQEPRAGAARRVLQPHHRLPHSKSSKVCANLRHAPMCRSSPPRPQLVAQRIILLVWSCARWLSCFRQGCDPRWRRRAWKWACL